VSENSIYIFAAVLVAIVAIVTLLMQVRNARDKRIASETKVADALDRNSGATDKLTSAVEGILETQMDHTVKLARHDVMIENLMNRPNVAVNVGPAHTAERVE
jgi:hypothetical protein